MLKKLPHLIEIIYPFIKWECVGNGLSELSITLGEGCKAGIPTPESWYTTQSLIDMNCHHLSFISGLQNPFQSWCHGMGFWIYFVQVIVSVLLSFFAKVKKFSGWRALHYCKSVKISVAESLKFNCYKNPWGWLLTDFFPTDSITLNNHDTCININIHQGKVLDIYNFRRMPESTSFVEFSNFIMRPCNTSRTNICTNTMLPLEWYRQFRCLKRFVLEFHYSNIFTYKYFSHTSTLFFQWDFLRLR